MDLDTNVCFWGYIPPPPTKRPKMCLFLVAAPLNHKQSGTLQTKDEPPVCKQQIPPFSPMA